MKSFIDCLKTITIAVILAWGICAEEGYAAVDSYTKLLLHCNGTNGSNVFTDSAASKSVSIVGNPQIDTSQFVFGGASGLFHGVDKLTLEDSEDWNLGGGDFSIDMWVQFSSLPTSADANASHFAGQWYYNTAVSWVFGFWNDKNPSVLKLAWSTDGTYNALGWVNVEWSPALNKWYHVAVTRKGSEVRFFVDGVQQGATQTVTATFYNVNTKLTIGGRIDIPAYWPHKGWFDEIRVSKGIARWTANFKPPVREYGFEYDVDNTSILHKINYQGRVKATSGAPVSDGTYSINFKIYDAESDGALLWEEMQPSVTVSKGIFNVLLGSFTSMENLTFAKPYYLEIQVGDEVMAPRQLLASAPYAIKAERGVPKGTILMWSGTTIPHGWALCDGSNGTPNLRDMFILTAGNSYSLGSTGGEATHTLTIDEIPSHRHAGDQAGALAGPNNYFASYGSTGYPYQYTSYAGGSAAHNNMPPYYALVYIMKL